MAENQVVFRQHNEKVQKGLEKLKKIAQEHGQEAYVKESNTPLYFYCECSDEKCRERIQLHPSRYNEIHRDRTKFVILCGHEVESIERVIKKEADHCIVEKVVDIPESANALRKTQLDNA